APHPLEVLQRHRPVQPEVAAQALHVFLRGLRAQHDGGRIARSQSHHPEDEQRDPDQDGQRQQDAAEDVALEARPSYCSHTCVSTRSKFGWSLNPCTRLRWTITCLPWSTKIHGASSTTRRCASR